MVPPEFTNLFIASASAGAALVGLLFVAVSIAPEHIFMANAPVEQHQCTMRCLERLLADLGEPLDGPESTDWQKPTFATI